MLVDNDSPATECRSSENDDVSSTLDMSVNDYGPASERRTSARDDASSTLEHRGDDSPPIIGSGQPKEEETASEPETDGHPQTSKWSAEAIFALLLAWPPLAVGVILTFVSFRQPTVPLWTAPVSIIVAITALITASIWLHNARKTAGFRGESAPRWRSSTRWLGIALYSNGALSLLMIYVLIQGLGSPPVTIKTYDGIAPEQHQCGSNVEPASDRDWDLLGPDSEHIGVISLVASVNCETVWAQIRHDQAGPLDGKVATITMIRDADEAKITYRSELFDNKRLSGGNMLQAGEACVRAEVTVVEVQTGRSGPTVATQCVSA